jgi:membrane protein YdbS with pleckstrin-like domain
MFGRDILESLKDGEEVIGVQRKHWASFLKQIFIAVLILIVPFFFIIFFFSRWWLMIIFFVWVTIGFAYALYQWFVWHYDSMVITTRRVINIDQKSLFSRSVAEVPLTKIQDITYEVHGMRASLFNYGRIEITSAGNSLSIDHIPDPEEVRDIIFELLERYRRRKKKKEVSAEDLIQFIKKHN